MPTPRPASPRAFRSPRLIGTLGLALAATLWPTPPAGAAAAPGGSEPVRLLIGFKRPGFSLSAATRGSILSRTRERARITELQGRVARHYTRADAVAATLSPEAAAALLSDPSVAYVEEDRPVHMLQVIPATESPELEVPHQLVPEVVPWGISGDDKTFGVRAVGSGATGEGVNVGVLDTGISAHPDLQIAGGYNFVANSEEYADDVGHGTHVAGTIAAQPNGEGLVGVAPKVRLYALKVLDHRGSGRTSHIVAGIEWAIAHDLRVINMSFGSNRGSQTEQRAIVAAAEAGVVMVAASGNEGGPVGYPAAYPEVIAVGAVGKSGIVARFSSRGPQLGLTAPGVNILSTVPDARGFTLTAAAREGVPGEMDVSGIRFSASTAPEGIVGPLRFAGRGTKEAVEAVDLKGAIALIERGDIPFYEKVANAAAAGAIGALIFNNEPGNYGGTLGSPGAIPALALTREEGLPLKESPGATIRVYVTPDSFYTRFSGTSMASPHVAGVAALVLSVRPELDPAGVRLILRQTATDLGLRGRDDSYGDGLVNATAAVTAARGLAESP
jgi:subtilisin family serine protease